VNQYYFRTVQLFLFTSYSELEGTAASLTELRQICSSVPTFVTDSLSLLNCGNLYYPVQQKSQIFGFLITYAVIDIQGFTVPF
jgi:hypothetical protein